MTTPRVSVIMPVYNASKFLAMAVDSVLGQSFSDFELIVVDDCSQDDSLQIAWRYQQSDKRVRVIAEEKNQGVARARNKGITQARGEYIALIDSDDIWRSDKLERQIALLENSGAHIAYCSYDFIDENGNSIMKPFIVPAQTDFRRMLTSSVISCSTAFIESSLLKEHKFNPDIYHEDYALWMELLSIPVKAVGDTEVLASYRQVSGSRSNNKGNAAVERWKIYRDVLNLSLPKSATAFIGYAVKGVLKYFL